MLAESIHSVADTDQPGPAVPGRRARRRGRATPGAPLRLRPRPLLLGASSSRWCCSWSAACSRSTRASRRSATRTRSTSPAVAFAILGVAVVLEIFSLRTAVPGGARPSAGASRGSAYIRRSKSPELPVVLLEDLGALIGLFARARRPDARGGHRRAAAGTASAPSPSASCWWSIAVILVVEMKSLLIGESATRRAAGARSMAGDRGHARRARASSTCARCTSAPTSCWWPPRSSWRRRSRHPRGRRRDRRGRGARARGRAHRPGDLPRAGPLRDAGGPETAESAAGLARGLAGASPPGPRSCRSSRTGWRSGRSGPSRRRPRRRTGSPR